MPRKARQTSNSGIYHIMVRGINRQIIFEDKEDINVFLHTLKKYKTEVGCNIYAYCLMKNHIHILMRIDSDKIGIFMRKLGAKYVYWYNWKYNRVGGLFQDRFKSEIVESKKYYLSVIRYIHQNPVKANLCSKVADYTESSYHEYISPRIGQLTDTEFTLKIISKDYFVEFCNEINNDECLDMVETNHINDNNAKQIIFKISKCKNASEFQTLDVTKRNFYIIKLKSNGLSIRQIERLTGISRGIVQNIGVKGINV